jgi:hypothetical protein
MKKLAPRLLILISVVATVAGLCGGWKWGDGSVYHGAAAAAVRTSAQAIGSV